MAEREAWASAGTLRTTDMDNAQTTTTSEWYLDRENWTGSHFEVAIELGPRDDGRLLQSLRSVWTSPLLNGPLVSPYGDQPTLDESLLGTDPIRHLHGTLEIDGLLLGCMVMALRWESDWLSVSIPTGMLHRAHRVDDPLYRESNFWLHDVEVLLANVADHVHQSVPFELAVIGEEASGSISVQGGNETRPITREAVEQDGGYLLSAELWQQLLPETRAQLIPSGLYWVPISLFARRRV